MKSITCTLKKMKTILLRIKFVFLLVVMSSFFRTTVFAQIGTALVAPPTGGFRIQGDLIANTPSSGIGDWMWNPAILGSGRGVLNYPSGTVIDPTKTFHRIDLLGNSDLETFTGGSSKYLNDPNVWLWSPGSVPAKNDINHALIHFSNDAAGNLWIMMGADRSSVSGTSYIDFELFQNTVTKNANGTFTSTGTDGGRTVGDLLFTVQYDNGGSQASIITYRWQLVSPGVYSYVVFTPATGTAFVASNIYGPVDAGYSAFGSTTYDQFAFAEAAVNVTQAIPGLNNCIGLKTIIIKTKTSTSATAQLKDLIDPVQIDLSTKPVVTVNSPSICSGSTATLTATATGGNVPYAFTWNAVANGSTNPNVFTTPTLTTTTTTTTYTIIATGNNGCASDPVVSTVTVNALPTVTCPVNTTVNACQTQGQVDAAFTTWLGTATGSNGTLTNNNNGAPSACGGTKTVIFSVTSNCGTATCSRTFTVTADVTAPVITLGSATTLSCNPTTDQINAAFGSASVTDNCSTGLTASGTVGAEVNSGTGCNNTTVTKSWTVTDACGNTGTASQTVTFTRDLTAPVITLTAASSLGCNPTTAQIDAAFGSASVTDNCSTGLTATGTVGAEVNSGTGCNNTTAPPHSRTLGNTNTSALS